MSLHCNAAVLHQAYRPAGGRMCARKRRTGRQLEGCRWPAMRSSAREFHPELLADRDVNLSVHPATRRTAQHRRCLRGGESQPSRLSPARSGALEHIQNVVRASRQSVRPKLFADLALARGDGCSRILRALGGAQVRILDDWGVETTRRHCAPRSPQDPRRTLRRRPIIRDRTRTTVQAVRKASFSLFRPFSVPWHHLTLMVRSPWFVWRRTNIWCPRDQALSKSRTAILPGGSVAQPKLMEGRRNHARSPQRAFLFLIMSVVVSLRSASCSNAPAAATMPRQLGSRP